MKTGPKGPRENSAATLFKKLIREGLSNDEVLDCVWDKFPKHSSRCCAVCASNAVAKYRYLLKHERRR